jgi:hypothetical protein
VVVSSREDFSSVVEDVTTDNTSYAPNLTQVGYVRGGAFWWKVAAMDEDRNLGDFTRAHSFSLKGTGTGGGVQTTQRLRLSMKGKLRAKRLRRVVVTVKAGARPIAGARVRAFGLGVVTRWKSTNRYGRVVFRLKPKVRGIVFLQATKTGYLSGSSRVRAR